MKLVFIVLGIIIFVLLYYIYSYITSGVKTLVTVLDCSTASTTIDGSKLSNPSSTTFAYGIWIYISDWSVSDTTNTNSLINIFYRNGSSGSDGKTMHVYIESGSPSLYVQFSPVSDGLNFSKNSASSLSSSLDTEVLVTNVFPLQKWVYLTISVDGGTYLDIYLDGKMVKTSILTQKISCESSTTTTSQIPGIIVGPFNGYISTFQSWGYALDPQTVWTYYMKGNGANLATNYNLDITLSKNAQEAGTYRLF